jgi:Delta7-sterol 5-desaturase
MTLPLYSLPVTFLILVLVMILRYFTLALIFSLIPHLKKTPPIEQGFVPTASVVRRDILWSILSSLIFAGAGTVLLQLWQSGQTKIYLDPFLYPLIYMPLSLFLVLFFHDTYFYWTHRLLHSVLFNRIHIVNHLSKVPTAWTSFSFHPLEALLQALILPALLVLIPLHLSVVILFLLTMSVTGVLNHLGYELYPAFLERKLFLISATHHQLHHRKVTKNFGLYFTLWDHWMNTEQERE